MLLKAMTINDTSLTIFESLIVRSSKVKKNNLNNLQKKLPLNIEISIINIGEI